MSTAANLGRAAGLAAASWVFDGNTMPTTYAVFLRWHEDGDPRLHDAFGPGGGWLSGEWADDPTPASLAEDLGLTDPHEVEEACDAYEQAADEAYWAELERIARQQVTP